jgi:hypothetical protein
MAGATQGALTFRRADLAGGGVYTGFLRTRDFGTAHLLVGVGILPVDKRSRFCTVLPIPMTDT